MKTRQKQLLERSGASKQMQQSITIGTVVDTNDPQQMGRVRVVCSAWGDTYHTPVEDLPWCIYMSPFGGQMSVGTRGAGNDTAEGGVAYGLWAIPKVNAQVIVACLDGDPSIRVYMGCVYDQFTPHTMPHGRWKYDDHPGLQSTGSTAAPQGPYSSRERPIEPLSTNINRAFTQKNEPNYERRARAADYTVAAVDVTSLDYTTSRVPDDQGVVFDGRDSTQGYAVSRSEPEAVSSFTDQNYDSQVYAFTTPGFHSLSMDDRRENCRIRLRTTAGHQILLDDTNERMYIQTAKGNNWIELDGEGNIDIYTANKVNVRAAKDINFTSDQSIRMTAAKGIHMYTEDEIRMHSKKDINVLSEQSIRGHSLQSTFWQADQSLHITAGVSFYLSAAQEIHEKCGSKLHLSSGASMHFNAGGEILETATAIHLNGPPAAVATSATAPSEQKAFWTNRVPDHEPWARTMTRDDFTHQPEFSYTSDQVNRSERGTAFDRGEFWRR